MLRDLKLGRTPTYCNLTETDPFNFKIAERPIFVLRQAVFYEEKIYRRHEGRSARFSIRIMEGVTYRVGVRQGYPVDTAKLTHIDTGSVAFSDQQIHFASQHKAFRVSYKTIAMFEPYSNGFKIIRDSASARPQLFITGRGWFVAELFRLLSPA